MVAAQLADAIYEKLRRESPSQAAIDERIEHAFLQIENKLNRKLLGVLFANSVAMLVVAFFLGGLWIQFSGVPQTLEGRGIWIRATEQRLQSLESWAVKQGTYEKPPAMVVPN